MGMMVWNDEPTIAQLGAVGRLIQWQVTQAKEAEAIKFLEAHATRSEVSREIKRLRNLYIDHKLSKDNVFDSEIWEGFEDA